MPSVLLPQSAAVCPITLEKIRKVLLVPNELGPRYTAFDFDAFMTWWGQNGTDPLTRKMVPLSTPTAWDECVMMRDHPIRATHSLWPLSQPHHGPCRAKR